MIAPLFYARLGLRKYASIAINGSTRGLRIYASIAINRLIGNDFSVVKHNLLFRGSNNLSQPQDILD